MAMTVEKLMTTHVVSICEDATIRDACRLLLRHHISGLPVVDAEGLLVGMVTESDLMGLLVEPVPAGALVADYMSGPCATLVADDSLLFALDQFRLLGFRRLPVIDDAGRPIGIVARRDFVRFVADVHLRVGTTAEPSSEAKVSTF